MEIFQISFLDTWEYKLGYLCFVYMSSVSSVKDDAKSHREPD